MLRKIWMLAALLLCAATIWGNDTEDIGTLPLPSPQVLAQIVVITPATVIDFQAIANPGNPSTGKGRVYFDSGSSLLTCLTSTGSSCMPSGGGGGGVSSFSAGNLSPLFTTSVATPTTTPALTFSISNAAANTVFGNFTGSPAAPTFTAAPTFSAANLTNFPTFNQNTTGSAGSITVLTTLGDTLYENATPANARLAGNTTATKNFLTQTGNGSVSAAPVWGTISAGDVPTLNQSTTGNAATATALAATPTNCGAGVAATGIAASGNAVGCFTPPTNPMTTLGDSTYGGASGVITRLAGPTTPNGVPQYWTDTPAAGAAVAEAWSLAGVPTNPQTGTTYTFLATDRASYVSFSNGSAIAVTLPQAGSAGFGSNFVTVACDIGAGTATITPTTSNISYTTGSAYTSAASSLALTTGQCAWIYSDNTNYFAILRGSGGSGTVTSIATTSPITGGTITTTGTIACATCVTSAASLTSTAIMTGAGSQGSQTPDATATLSAGGALAGVTLPINDVVSATGAIATIADGNNPLVINCALTSGTTCLTTGETTAATTAGAVEHQITTLTTTTAIPLQITQGANGPANANAPAVLNVSAAAAGGLAGASNAGSVGAPITLLTGAGSAGGATTGIGGAGGAASLTTGAGGAAGGTATNNGGNAGAINLTTGAGGNGGTGAATAGSGGNVVVTLGAPGTNSATGTAGAVGQFQVTGNAPASTANAAGVASGTTFLVSGVTGGASSNASGTAGVGSIATVNGGAGGAGTGTNAVGGAGGAVNLSPGNGGASLGTGVNSNGGSVVATPGAAGTGGSGTAGKAGVLSVAGTTAGAVALTQGTAVTTSNTNIPANSIIEMAPTAVTAYTLTKPGAAPTNNFSVKSTTTAGVESYAKMPQTAMLTSQYTNSTTGFTNVSLSFNLDASTTYQGYCTLYYQAASTGGLNIEFTGPASPTFVTYGLVDPGSATTIVAASVATAYSTSLGAAVTTATTNFPATVTFGISNGTTSGTLQLLAKSSAAVQLQIQTGSYCVMQ